MDDEIRTLIAGWGAAWGLPHLESDIHVTFSSRLTQSLGRCRPSTGRITLQTDLQQSNRSQLAEVLCHEVAHIAVFQLFGSQAKPHGPEWQRLVSEAGYGAEVQARRIAGTRLPRSQRSPFPAYEHRCPICQSVRFARRPVGRWRCAECVDAGLPGELVITRHQGSQPK